MKIILWQVNFSTQLGNCFLKTKMHIVSKWYQLFEATPILLRDTILTSRLNSIKSWRPKTFLVRPFKIAIIIKSPAFTFLEAYLTFKCITFTKRLPISTQQSKMKKNLLRCFILLEEELMHVFLFWLKRWKISASLWI